MEGQATVSIAEWSGFTKGEIQSHRTGGHASKNVTEMVLTAQSNGGVLEPLANIVIANKVNRIRNIDRLVHGLHRVLELRAEKWGETHKDVPGIETGWVLPDGRVDTDLARIYKDLHEHASKEGGEWRPDGGAKAEATNNLAHAIIVHAKGSLPPPRIEQAEVIEAELEDRDHNM
jgi:hypothetical protein